MITDAQKWLVLAGIIFAGWLLYRLSPVLTPFLISALLAYLCDPFVDKLEKLKISRTVAVIIVFTWLTIVILLCLLIIVPIIENQLSNLVGRLPRLINWLEQTAIPYISEWTGIEVNTIELGSLKKAVTENWKDIGNVISLLLIKLSQSGQVLLTWFAYLVLIPVVTFYLLRDWDDLVEKIHTLIPRGKAKLVSKLALECDAVLSEFLRGQLLVMLCLGIIYSIGLWIAGIEFALLIGLLAGLVSFVPYLGAIVGVGVAGIAAFVQFQDIIHLLYVMLVFGFGQAIEGMLLSPVLVGDRIGLHPVAVIFAVMAGGQLFGFFGVLLALPVAAVIVVLLRYIHSEYIDSSFYTL